MGTYVTVRVENEGTVSRCGWKYGLFDEMLKKLARAVKVPELASFYCGGGGHGEVYRMIAPLRNDVMEKEHQDEITGAEADRLVVLEKGKIAEQGTHAELVDKEGGVYAKLHKTQMELATQVAVAG